MTLTKPPIIELHCHLDGILDPNMARAIRQGEAHFPIDPAEFERAYPVFDMHSFFNWWNFIKPVEGSLLNFFPVLSHHIARLKAQGVVYAEIMIAVGEVPHDPVLAAEQVAALREWMNQQEEGRIQVEFLICIGRNRSLEEFERRANRVFPLFEKSLITGVALAGPEIGYPVRPLHKIFGHFHEAGLKIEIHAGEWCGPESIWDALEFGFPDRIGHGVSLFQDPKLVEIFQERQIHIEMCPTSNVKTGSVSCIEEHPVQKARELGMNFSINTDDPGAFLCSLDSEYQLLAEVFGFDEVDFRRIYANSLNARFQPKIRLERLSPVT